jgi:AcrR family transcriptional regulator
VATAPALVSVRSGSKPTTPPQIRAGGRSARVVAGVLAATLETLGKHGYVGLRVEDVAARAGVNKTTIYRRWPTRAELVVAALTRLAGPPQAPECGRLEPDLLALFMSATTLRATPAGRGIVSALIAERGDPEVDRICGELREMHRRPARVLLEHARDRGELPRRTDSATAASSVLALYVFGVVAFLNEDRPDRKALGRRFRAGLTTLLRGLRG